MDTDSQLTETRIRSALSRLSELLQERDAEGELCLLGGTAMVLVFRARPSTKDVDAIFEPTGLIRELAGVVREEQNLPEDWLNDGAKGFVSADHEVETGDLPQFPALRVVAPTAEYLLALKCMASRIPADPDARGDVPDIELLIRHLGLRTADEVIRIVERYYPKNRIPARARFVIEDILESRNP